SLPFVRDDFVRVFSRRNVEPTREFTHGSCPGLVVCCWRMPNTTPGITGSTRRGADRFRGRPHLCAPSCHPSMNFSSQARGAAGGPAAPPGRPLVEPLDHGGDLATRHACKLGCEGIVSKRLNSPYVSGRSPDWLKMKNANAPAVKREAEED